MADKKCSKCGILQARSCFAPRYNQCKRCTYEQRKHRQPKEVLPNGAKRCSVCRAIKKLEEFSPRKEGRFRRNAKCRPCVRKAALPYERATKERKRVRILARRLHDPEVERAGWRRRSERARRNPSYRLHLYVSNAIRYSLRGKTKSRSTFEALGFTKGELMSHLERQFLHGMTWGNYGEWHIDHIVPLASFRISGVNCSEFRAAWALTNLRPLWATENVQKQATRTHLV